jgi:transcriptional regulator with PAS, ATPase and Fis domain
MKNPAQYDFACSGLRTSAPVAASAPVSIPIATVSPPWQDDTIVAAPAGAVASSPSRPVPAMADRASALTRLDTGDARLAAVIARVRRVLAHDIAILITGETGTGKELLARAIHHDSPGRTGAFVAVNCSAIPEALIEAELFGHEEGAFTGARRRGHAGKIRQAGGGTLFLDEIGDMPPGLQARLLRVLQQREVVPLGGTRAVAVDLRVVCATNRDLRRLVASGEFRQDLYYRLNGLLVRLPPLRERSDIAVLVQRLLIEESSGLQRDRGGARHAGDRDDATVPALTPQAMTLLLAHRWPGNLRQLASLLRTAIVMAGASRPIGVEHLADDFLEDAVELAGGAQEADPPAAPVDPDMDSARAALIRQALRRHGGNVSAAARALGISRNTVYRHRLA